MNTKQKLPACCEASSEEARCVFGCGSVVDSDTRICRACRDHSANAFECETCGRMWEKWGSEWEERATEPLRVLDYVDDSWMRTERLFTPRRHA